ncbi:hypothetical protein KY290_035937 [Solanum tuberosum]|uniref:Uncharacterized protein n=1 Tax=Solanum tuberosum TaxID=4113 RepID=A0ABQ7TRC7_SOLTU|nr:hypothetical protein KY290_035937 [Solanum tuberosum]
MLFEQYHWKKALKKNQDYEFKWNQYMDKDARDSYYFNWPMTKEANDPCPEIQSILSPASIFTRGRGKIFLQLLWFTKYFRNTILVGVWTCDLEFIS